VADLGQAGNLLFATERFAAARDAFEALMPLLQASGDDQRLIHARGFRASCLSRLGVPAEARPLLEESAEEARDAGYAPLEMLVQSDLGTVCRNLGPLAAAEEHSNRALELARQLGDRGNEAIVLTQLARLRLAQARPDEALAACESAAALASDLASPPLQLVALTVRAEYDVSRGDERAARACYEQALALPCTPWRRANLLGALGDVEMSLGDTLSAASHYREAASLANHVDDPVLLATTTLGLGRVERAMGDLASAREAFQAALAALGDSGLPANRSAGLLYLSSVQAELGERAEARRCAEEARRISHAAADPVLEARAVVALAEVDRLEGNAAARLARAQECMDLLTEARRPLDAARALALVAQALLRVGRTDEAIEMATVAVAQLKEMHSERDLVHPLCTLAEGAMRLADPAAASGWLNDAEHVLERLGQARGDLHEFADLRSGETEHTPGQLAQDLAALRLQLAGKNPELHTIAIEAGLRSCGAWKGLELLGGLELQRGGGEDAEAARLLSERRRVLADRDAAVAELVAATAAGRPSKEKAVVQKRIEGCDARVAALTKSLAGLSPREALVEQPPTWGLKEVRARLSPQDVYVEYAESMQRLYAYVITLKTAELRDLGPRAERAAEVEAFVAGLSDPAHLASAAQVAEQGSALYRTLLGDLLPAGAPADARLIVVPCALVSPLPFEALVVAAPAAPASFRDVAFVLDRREVIYAPSGPVFSLMEQAAPRAAPGRALVLGDPVYPPASGSVPRGSRDPRSLGFVRLPGTRDEALGIAQRLIESAGGADGAPDAEAALTGARDATDVALDTPAVRLCLGERAAADALRGDLREFSLIHCATHGHADAQDPRLTGLALTPQGDDDGFVTLADVLELSLDADLAVLSACETGRGRERRGDGTQSLARAFLHAGARAVVSSLWQVDDHETEKTMQGFYEGMAGRGLTAAAALREARLAIRNAPAAPEAFRGVGRGKLLPGAAVPAPASQGRPDLAGHPFFWAAFTYVGAPDHRPLAAAAR